MDTLPPPPPLDPEIALLAARFDAAMGGPGLSLEELRGRYAALLAEQGPPPCPIETRALSVPTRHGPMAARLYLPPRVEAAPLLLYMHGGGFMVGDLESLDTVLHGLCRAAGVAILSLDYALAPEHRFPVALEQCEDALLWAAHGGAAGLGCAPRLAVGGDSAGGNLSALLALRHGDALSGQLVWQLLVNPVLDFPGVEAGRKRSHREFGTGPILNIEVMKGFNAAYFDGHEALVAASPLHALPGRRLPPAFIAAAECDPLRDDALEYGDRLHDAGIAVDLRVYPGMCHNFITMAHRSTTARRMLAEAASAARDAMHSAG